MITLKGTQAQVTLDLELGYNCSAAAKLEIHCQNSAGTVTKWTASQVTADGLYYARVVLTGAQIPAVGLYALITYVEFGVAGASGIYEGDTEILEVKGDYK